MTDLDRTIKCPHCGELYKAYTFSAADQSACPSCVQKADSNMNRKQLPEHPQFRYKSIWKQNV